MRTSIQSIRYWQRLTSLIDMVAPDGFQFVEFPDLRAVSELMLRTWPRPCWNYDLQLLEFYLRRSSIDPSLAVGTINRDGTLASYEALSPIKVVLFGAPRRAVFASFFTVAPEQQGNGLSIVQEQVLIERAIEKGYEIYLVMCDASGRANDAIKRVFAKLAIPVTLVRTFGRFVAANDVVRSRLMAHTSSGRTQLYQSCDRQALLSLIDVMGNGTDLHKKIPESEVDHIFRRQAYSQSFVFRGAEKLRAVATVVSHEVLFSDGSKKTNIYFRNVAFGDLTGDEQLVFLGDMLSSLMEQGFYGAFLPDIGYVSIEPFWRFGFRKAPGKINLYLAPLQRDVVIGGPPAVRTLHLDIF